MSQSLPDLAAEWLEADGLGGFASGTVGGWRSRRYHALLLTARQPPTDRLVLVNGCDVHVEADTGTFALSTQHYLPDAFAPEGFRQLESFTVDPWPTWRWRFPGDLVVEQQFCLLHGRPVATLSWHLVSGTAAVRLRVRPFLSVRDYHGLLHEDAGFRFAAEEGVARVAWHPFSDRPAVHAFHNGTYQHEPHWYRQFFYATERERGLDDSEDLAAPGLLTFDLAVDRPAVCLFAAEGCEHLIVGATENPVSACERVRDGELRRRRSFPSALHRAADQYIVSRGDGQTIVAGYPWFTDWGRDTFIALRGLCLALGWLDTARDMLIAWAGTVSEGMLPNRFPDYGQPPEYNSVDASLWFIIAIHDWFTAVARQGGSVSTDDRECLLAAQTAILTGYREGTRYRIHSTADGLLAAGQPGVQLTWMDAKVGDWVVTPRIGKPVEVQALWLNALALAARTSPDWQSLYETGLQSFRTRFWNPTAHCLYDIVDVDHEAGVVSSLVRPNQLLAVGGLPLVLLPPDQARLVVDVAEKHLLTPLGLRTLAPTARDYAPRCTGSIPTRDGAYHQGTVWPWLIGPFVEAWVRVRGNTPEARQAARERFLPPLEAHLATAGLGHISEITDGDPPHTPRGCPFQAWSLGEYLRLEVGLLRESGE